MHYLLDTNICIYLIKNHPVEVFERFQQHSIQDVGISIITLYELEYGAEKSQARRRSKAALAKFLQPLQMIDLDLPAVKFAAEIHAHLEKKGTPIGPYDLLIAGIARSRNMTLVTNNVSEFKRVDNLLIENWVDV